MPSVTVMLILESAMHHATPEVAVDLIALNGAVQWQLSTQSRHQLNTIPMNFDDQVRRYFGTSDLSSVPPSALEAGIEHMKVDLGLIKDPGERFALWSLLHVLGSAPDLDAVFEDAHEREAARNFMDLLHGASDAQSDD